jgi:hypothetical protein
MINTIATFEASRSRRYDIAVVRRHALEVFNTMRANITDFPVGELGRGDPGAEFLLGG